MLGEEKQKLFFARSGICWMKVNESYSARCEKHASFQVILRSTSLKTGLENSNVNATLNKVL